MTHLAMTEREVLLKGRGYLPGETHEDYRLYIESRFDAINDRFSAQAESMDALTRELGLLRQALQAEGEARAAAIEAMKTAAESGRSRLVYAVLALLGTLNIGLVGSLAAILSQHH